MRWAQQIAAVLGASCWLTATCWLTSTAVVGQLPSAASTKPKRPVAMVWAERWLWVANQRAGSITVVDRSSLEVVNEVAHVGKSLTDLALSEDQSWLVAVDSEAAELVWLKRSGQQLAVVKRQATAADPQKIAWHYAARHAAVTCRWSRRVVCYQVVSPDQWVETRQVDLPFCPRELVFIDDQTLVVADAFGGHLAVVDWDSGLRHLHRLTGHNLWGLTLSPQRDRLLLNMQRLNSFRPTTYEDIFWGGVMQNMMVELKRHEVLRPPTEEGLQETVYFLGRPSEGTGDPTALLVSADGYSVVALGGIHQVAVRPTPFAPLEYRSVGKRPVALCRPDGDMVVFVLCQMDDTLYELDLAKLAVSRHVALSPNLEQDAASLGEALFYDATLALDGWFSCHSCHTDGHTTGLLNDNFGDDSQGAPKRIPSLRGTADTGPWAWSGRMETLEEQVRKSLTRTMQAGTPDEQTVNAIVAYLRTLPPIPPLSDPRSDAKQQIEQGAALFARRGCADCHAPPTYTTPLAYDVQIHDQVGNTNFNPPSLRGVRLRDAFFHDNRATSLPDVFLRFRHPSDTQWTPQEVEAIVAFLQSL